MSSSRTALVGVAAFAAGLAVGLLLAGVRDVPTDDAERAPSADAAPALSPAAAATPRDTRPRVRASSSHASEEVAPLDATPALVLPPRNAGDPDVREIALAGAPTGWGDVDVQILYADGTPGNDEQVVAIREGADSSSDDATEAAPFARTDAQGGARLRLPSPGRYTVIFDRSTHRLEGHVTLPGGGRVVLRDPEWREIWFHLEDGAPPETKFAPRAVACEGTITAPDGTILARGTDAESGGEVTPDSPVRRIEVAAGIRWRFESGNDLWRCVPAEGEAPCKVEVRRTGRVALKVVAHLCSSDPAVAVERYVNSEWDAGAGRVPLQQWVQAHADPNESWGEIDVPVAKPQGIVRWAGPDIASGEAAYDLADAEPLLVEVIHRPLQSADARTARVVVPDSDALEKETHLYGRVFRSSLDARSGDDVHEVDMYAGIEARFLGDGTWLVVTRRFDEDAASREIAGPLRLLPGRRTELPLVRAGWLVVVPRAMPPQTAGRVEIVRADGAPLVAPNGDDDPVAQPRVTVSGGTVLGPFAPGTVVLEVLVGRIRWQRLEVVVRAGEYTALPIGPFGGAERR